MSTTPKQKHVGWVIVTPKGKVLRWTIHFIKDDSTFGDSAWGLFCDCCEEHREVPDDFGGLGMVPAIKRHARKLGYRARKVYTEASQ